MMAGHEYNYNTREPNPVYTPSLDSDDDMPQVGGLNLTDKNYRQFSFRRDGKSWAGARGTEVFPPEGDIKARAKRPRKEKHSVDYQMKKMSDPRRRAIEDLLESVQLQDPLADDWSIVAIDNDNQEHTKRTAEVLAFSVILARVAPTGPLSNPTTSAPANRSTKPSTQERRKSVYASSAQEPSLPARRASKHYSQNPFLEKSEKTDKTNKSTQPAKPARPANFEDDPFGISHLFSSEGKPIDPVASTPYTGVNPGSSRMTQNLFGESTTTKSQKPSKEKQGKKGKKSKDENGVDFDAIFGIKTNAADLLCDPLDDTHEDYRLDQDQHHSSDYDDSPLEMEPEDHDPKPRGRKRNDSGFASQTPIVKSLSAQKSKSRPRKPSVHIPRDTRYGPRPVDITSYDTPSYATHDTPKYSSRPFDRSSPDKYNPRTVPVDMTTNGRRRQQQYYSSQISAETAPSARSYSDHSILEAEYEEYSSSNSSEDHLDQYDQHTSQQHPDPWSSNPYTNPDGRYKRATRDHRRGPPSPQYPRHDPRYEPDPIPYTTLNMGNPSPGGAGPGSTSSSTRRPRPDRPLSEHSLPTTTSGPLQRYHHQYSPPTPSNTTPRPPLISQPSRSQTTDPYYTALHPSPLYPTTPSTLIYPSDLAAHQARAYITDQAVRDKDQELERLRWERDMAISQRDLARREMELHREDVRRGSVVVGQGLGGGMGSRGSRDRDLREVGVDVNMGMGIGGGIGMEGVDGRERRSGRERRYTHEPRNSRRYTDFYHP